MSPTDSFDIVPLPVKENSKNAGKEMGKIWDFGNNYKPNKM